MLGILKRRARIYQRGFKVMSDDEGFIVFLGAAFLIGTWLEEHPGILEAIYFIKNHFLLILACVGLVVIGMVYIKNRIER
jgi:hypothetical protein